MAHLRLPNSCRDAVEHTMADDTEGKVVAEEVITFLGGSSVSGERLQYPCFCSGLVE